MTLDDHFSALAALGWIPSLIETTAKPRMWRVVAHHDDDAFLVCHETRATLREALARICDRIRAGDYRNCRPQTFEDEVLAEAGPPTARAKLDISSMLPKVRRI